MDNITTGIQNLLTNAIEFIPSLIAALVIFVVSLYLAGLLSKLIKNSMRKRGADQELIIMVNQITRWSVIILGIIAALQQIGFDVTSFLAGLGILGFTLGFALQDVSKNFIAGLLLLWQQPFDIGDTIKVADFTGTVVDIEIRATEMITLDGLYVNIPNGDVFTSAIVNYTREKTRRIELNVGVAYGTDLEKAQQIALQAISETPGVLPEPAPTVIYKTFGDSSINFTAYYWIDTTEPGYLGGMDQGVQSINTAFEREGIEIPFPIRTVYMKNSNS